MRGLQAGFLECLKLFTGESPLYLAVPLMAALLAVLKPSARRQLLFAALLSLAVYNSFTMGIYRSVVGETATFYRLLWLFPGWIAAGYLAVSLLRFIKNDAVMVAVSAALIAAALTGVTRRNGLSLPDNKYQIYHEVIEAADIMQADMDERGLEFAKVMCGRNTAITLREYNAHLLLSFSPKRLTQLLERGAKTGIRRTTYEFMTNQPGQKRRKARRLLKKAGVEYIVCPREAKKTRKYLRKLKWKVIGETDNYLVYRRRKVS